MNGVFLFLHSEDGFQFFQMGNCVGGFDGGNRIDMVYKNRIHPRIDGSLDVSIQVVADHDAFPERCTGLVHRKFKYFFFRLQAVAGFGGDYMSKIAVQAAVVEFIPLRFFKPVGDKMQRVFFSDR